MNDKRHIALAESINSFHETASPKYQKTVPQLLVENGTVANFTGLQVMLNEGYAPIFNEFIGGLVNMISAVVVETAKTINPLRTFKKGSNPFGTDIQLIFTNPAEAEDQGLLTDENQMRAFKVYEPDTKVAYLRINRGKGGLGDVYPITVSRDKVRRAMRSIGDLDDYLTSVIRSLIAGDEKDEFLYTKKLINNVVANNQIIIKGIASEPTTEAELKEFSAQLREDYLNFQISSVNNNAYTHFENSQGNPAQTMTQPGEISVIILNKILARMDVNVLANAFNLSRAEVQGKIHGVDSLDPGVYAVLCDDSWLQIYDQDKYMDEQHNGRTGATNYFWHATGWFDIKPWANAIAYVNTNNKPSISATAIEVSKVDATVGDTVFYRFTPANATDEVQIVDGSGAVVSTGFTLDKSAHSVSFSEAGEYAVATTGTSPIVSDTITVVE